MTGQLEGKKVLITREAKQARVFADKVRRHGGIPVEVPLLKITCRQRPQARIVFQSLAKYDWIFFTSVNGVNCFMEQARANHITLEDLKQKRYAAVGTKTEQALHAQGISTHFTPSVYDADHMAAEFLNSGYGKDTVLLVRGNLSREVLPDQFSRAGVHFDMVEVYETAENTQAYPALKAALYSDAPDFITFTSPSSVDVFMKLNKRAYIREGAVCVCIGTTTEKRAKEAGFAPVAIPEQFTIEGMLTCMLEASAQKG
jgi:uroporphyrinogen-III synthase